jgi:hypothetical protein
VATADGKELKAKTRCETLTMVSTNNNVFWDLKVCIKIEVYRRFGESY